jgi:adenylate cyclase
MGKWLGKDRIRRDRGVFPPRILAQVNHFMDLHDVLPYPPRVLVADDDPNIREILTAYLEAAGCVVISVGDGGQAWQTVQLGKIDLALLDQRMPGKTGFEVCRLIKENPATRWIPVMLVTAHDSEPERLEAIDAGADEFLGKPFPALILMTRARSLLRLRALHLEVEARNALLRKVLTRYVAEGVAEDILTNPEEKLRLGGEHRLVTVLFADLKGFTHFTESHSAPQAVDLLNAVFPALTGAIFRHGGTFDKYIGDAVMAFFGAPLSAPDDAGRAAETAREMQRRFAERMHSYGPDGAGLALGIGVHTGEAIVGNIGSEQVMDYTVVGDTVNLARRLQKDAPGGEIWMSEAAWRAAGQPPARPLGPHAIPGRKQAVIIYALVWDTQT